MMKALKATGIVVVLIVALGLAGAILLASMTPAERKIFDDYLAATRNTPPTDNPSQVEPTPPAPPDSSTAATTPIEDSAPTVRPVVRSDPFKTSVQSEYNQQGFLEHHLHILSVSDTPVTIERIEVNGRCPHDVNRTLKMGDTYWVEELDPILLPSFRSAQVGGVAVSTECGVFVKISIWTDQGKWNYSFDQ